MKRALAAGAAALVVAVSGCSSSGSEVSGKSSPSDVPQKLTVFAAASLQQTFTELGQEFESSHPGSKVVFSFGGSSGLVTQLQQGAPADIFASANTSNMDKATGADLIAGKPVDFATNTLEIAVPPGNPAKVKSLQDLTKPGTKVVLCAPEVPCGAAAKKVETESKLDIKPVSEESSVTNVLSKVRTGQADAGLVYVTDVLGAGDAVEGVTFPESSAAVNHYPIGALASAENPSLARAFITFVTGATGQKVLAGAGFAKP